MGKCTHIIIVSLIIILLIFNLPIQNEVSGAELTAAFSTGFNVTRDGFSFENYGDYITNYGHCYGVAMISALYYEGMKERPGGAEPSYEIEYGDVSPLIHDYQLDSWEDVWYDQDLNDQRNRWDLDDWYGKIRPNIIADNPVLLSFHLRSSIGGYIGHCTVAYKIEEYDDNTARIYVYDSNFAYDGGTEYIQYFTFDFDDGSYEYSGNLWSSTYPNYDYLLVIEPQLSHKDQYWQTWGIVYWLGGGAALFLVFLILLILFKKEKEKLDAKDIIAAREAERFSRKCATDKQPEAEPATEPKQVNIPGLSERKEGDAPVKPRPRPKSRTVTVESKEVERVSLGKDKDNTGQNSG